MHHTRRSTDNFSYTSIHINPFSQTNKDIMEKHKTWYKDESNLQKPPQYTANPYKLQKLGWSALVAEQSAMIYLNLVVHLKNKHECNSYTQKLVALRGFYQDNLPGPGEISIPLGFFLQ
jgi:hypothetical protein